MAPSSRPPPGADDSSADAVHDLFQAMFQTMRQEVAEVSSDLAARVEGAIRARDRSGDPPFTALLFRAVIETLNLLSVAVRPASESDDEEPK